MQGFLLASYEFKDPVTNKKKVRPQKIWIHSLSRWINIWIVCPRCNWSGLKSLLTLLSTQGARHSEAVETQGAPERDSCQPISAPWRAVCRAGGFGPVGLQAGDGCSSPPVRGPSGFLHPHRALGNSTPGTAAQQPVESQKEVCLVLSTRWLSFRKEFPTTASFLFLSPLGQPLPTTPASHSCSSPGALGKWVRHCEARKNNFSPSLSVSRSNGTLFCRPDLVPSNSLSPSTPCPARLGWSLTHPSRP